MADQKEAVLFYKQWHVDMNTSDLEHHQAKKHEKNASGKNFKSILMCFYISCNAN